MLNVDETLHIKLKEQNVESRPKGKPTFENQERTE